MNKQETPHATCAAEEVRKEITVTISGKAYERLELLAKSLNEWHPYQEDPNTPKTVFEAFFNFDITMLDDENPIETIANVVETVDCFNAKTNEDEKKERDRLNAIMYRNFGMKEVA